MQKKHILDEELTCRLMLVSSTLFSVRLEMVKVWLLSSKCILRVALDLVLQICQIHRSKKKGK